MNQCWNSHLPATDVDAALAPIPVAVTVVNTAWAPNDDDVPPVVTGTT